RLTTDAEARYHAMEDHCLAVLIPDADSSMWVGKPMVGSRDGGPWNDLSNRTQQRTYGPLYRAGARARPRDAGAAGDTAGSPTRPGAGRWRRSRSRRTADGRRRGAKAGPKRRLALPACGQATVHGPRRATGAVLGPPARGVHRESCDRAVR